MPVFYGYLVYKSKIIVRKPNFSDRFKKIIKRYKKLGEDLVPVKCILALQRLRLLQIRC